MITISSRTQKKSKIAYKWELAIAVLGRRVRTVDSSEQSEQPHHHYLPVPGRPIQRRPPVRVLCDYVGPIFVSFATTLAPFSSSSRATALCP
jgi:hypothetical protein